MEPRNEGKKNCIRARGQERKANHAFWNVKNPDEAVVEPDIICLLRFLAAKQPGPASGAFFHQQLNCIRRKPSR